MKLLSVGHDLTVLASRARLLEQAGFDVFSTTDIDEAVLAFSSRLFHAVLVGDSIPVIGREVLLEELRSASAETPIICACRGNCQYPAELHILCVDKYDPAKLLRVIRDSVRELGAATR